MLSWSSRQSIVTKAHSEAQKLFEKRIKAIEADMSQMKATDFNSGLGVFYRIYAELPNGREKLLGLVDKFGLETMISDGLFVWERGHVAAPFIGFQVGRMIYALNREGLLYDHEVVEDLLALVLEQFRTALLLEAEDLLREGREFV